MDDIQRNVFYRKNNDKISLSKHYSGSLTNNVLLLGNSGTGKTSNYTIKNILKKNSNYIVTSSDPDVYSQTYKEMKNNGYYVFHLNLYKPSESDSYNPFSFINKDSDIDTLLIPFLRQFNNNINNTELNLLRLILIDNFNYDIELDFNKLHNLLGNSEYIKDLLQNKKLYEYNKNINKLTEGEVNKARLELYKKNSALNISEIQPVFCQNDLSLEDLKNEKYIIYITLNKYHWCYNCLANILINQIFNYINELLSNDDLEIEHIHFIFDDCQDMRKIHRLETMLLNSKYLNINFSLIFNNIEQIVYFYQEKYKQLIQRINVIIFYSSNDLNTQNFLNKIIKTDKYKLQNLKKYCLLYNNTIILDKK